MKVKNLGVIHEANVTMANMNIFYGKNTHGKTYMSYAIYGALSEIANLDYKIVSRKDLSQNNNQLVFKIDKTKLIDKITKFVINTINSNSSKIIQKTFADKLSPDSAIQIEEGDIKPFIKTNLKKGYTKNYRININGLLFNLVSNITNTNDDSFEFIFSVEQQPNLFEDDNHPTFVSIDDIDSNSQSKLLSNINKTIVNHIFETRNILYFPAERAGINVFKNEINKNRSDRVSKKENTLAANYPLAIADYLVYLNFVSNFSDFFDKQTVTKYRWDIWSEFLKNIIQGKFEEKDDEIFFRSLYGKVAPGKKIKYQSSSLPLPLISSSLKTLYGFDFYIKNIFRHKDVLFIDEPEMNLDPEKQVKLSKILYALSNAGVRVYISTHSDFVLRYFTNMSLSESLDNKENIGIFHFDGGSVQKIDPSKQSEKYFEYFDLQYEKLQDEFINLTDKINDKY